MIPDNVQTQIRSLDPKAHGALRRALERRYVNRLDSSAMTLSQFAESGQILRVRSRLLGEDLWWVADETLRAEVPDPNLLVYTAEELVHLVRISPQDLINIHRIKKTFDGRIEN